MKIQCLIVLMIVNGFEELALINCALSQCLNLLMIFNGLFGFRANDLALCTRGVGDPNLSLSRRNRCVHYNFFSVRVPRCSLLIDRSLKCFGFICCLALDIIKVNDDLTALIIVDCLLRHNNI